MLGVALPAAGDEDGPTDPDDDGAGPEDEGATDGEDAGSTLWAAPLARTPDETLAGDGPTDPVAGADPSGAVAAGPDGLSEVIPGVVPGPDEPAVVSCMSLAGGRFATDEVPVPWHALRMSRMASATATNPPRCPFTTGRV
jgi:hypothetical protein